MLAHQKGWNHNTKSENPGVYNRFISFLNYVSLRRKNYNIIWCDSQDIEEIFKITIFKWENVKGPKGT